MALFLNDSFLPSLSTSTLGDLEALLNIYGFFNLTCGVSNKTAF